MDPGAGEELIATWLQACIVTILRQVVASFQWHHVKLQLELANNLVRV